MKRNRPPSLPPWPRSPRTVDPGCRRCKLTSPDKNGRPARSDGRGEQYLLVGEVVKPHGVRGELAVRSLTERPEIRFAAGAVLMLGADEKSLRQVRVERARPHKQGFLLWLDCVADRDGAEQIRGQGLYIRATDVAEPLESESYYHHQLIGMTVRDNKLGELGRVVALAETPAHDLLEIAGPGQPSFYLPLIGRFVLSVDVETGEIVTEVPPGLMET